MKPSLLAVCVVSVLFAADWGGEVRTAEVARFPSYTEGVAVDHAGNLYVSHASQISKVTPDGQVSVWATTVSPNGHKVLAYAAGKLKFRHIRILEGDGVQLELSPYDLTRGRIVWRNK